MTIDKSWIWKDKRSDEFWNGLQAFLVRCKGHLNFEGKCRCPCRNCNNVEWGTIEELEHHIHSKGFCRAYQTWIFHGESYVMPGTAQHIPETTCQMRDALNDVARENIGIEHHTGNEHQTGNEENSNEPTEGPTTTNSDLDELFTLAETPLYPDCDWMSSLDFLAKISHMKAINHWTDTSFDQLLELLRFAFPKDNKIPKSHYVAKKLMKKVGLGYESIHACKNDCCLFWKENEDKERCPICNESRWKDNATKGKKREKDGCYPTLIEGFRDYHSKYGQIPLPRLAQEQYDKMMALNREQEGVENPMTQDQILDEVLGTRRGFKRARGYVVPRCRSTSPCRASTSSGKTYTQEEVDAMIKETRMTTKILSKKVDVMVDYFKKRKVDVEFEFEEDEDDWEDLDNE